ncbi:hypothetical protein HF086_009976 [Spodoptera exigua]|uniref:Uncharacterized protein n=1 Tax=Spodoptera exigua TaxID=7107 RepID=A0A922SKZ3_SPOEX|nr:hypothetical protein HF086_009976 [Spodoptera exigua]
MEKCVELNKNNYFSNCLATYVYFFVYKQIKLKSYEWVDGKWHQIHVINSIDCHGMLMYLTFAALKVNYDKKNCMILKNVDVNQLQHIWVSGMPYGRVLWRSECYSKAGMLVCKEMETVTAPDYYG